MGGWNLPPGVSVSDIPGNRPEDLAAERMAETTHEFFERALAHYGTPERNPAMRLLFDAIVALEGDYNDSLCDLVVEQEVRDIQDALSTEAQAMDYYRSEDDHEEELARSQARTKELEDDLLERCGHSGEGAEHEAWCPDRPKEVHRHG
ncbi:MAG: hypothetical protein LC623_05730 [Halobacteriales archaeon]|nr:hypothetical protein [Halobacteriales archaeon]